MPSDRHWLRYGWLLVIGILVLVMITLIMAMSSGASSSLRIGGVLGLTGLAIMTWAIARIRLDYIRRMRTAEATLRLLLESSAECIVGVSRDARVLFMNPVAGRLFGYEPEAALGKHVHDVIQHTCPDKTASVVEDCPIVRACQLDASSQLDGQLLRRRDGTSFLATCASSPIRENARTIGAVLRFMDLTAHHHAEDELRESEARYRKLLAATFEAIVIHNEDGVILEVNHAFESMFGIPGMLAAGLPLEVFLSEATRQVFLSGIRHGSESSSECVGVRMDGTLLNIEVVTKAHTYKGQPIRVTALRNITLRKRAEHRQRAQLAISQILIDAPTLEEAMPHLLEAVCKTMEGDVGNVWLLDRDAGVLRWFTTWHAVGTDAAAFEAASQRLQFTQGQGLPGRVWDTGKPVWIRDISQEVDAPRASLAAANGLSTAFAFPIGAGTEVYGVVECFSRELHQPDGDVFEMMADIGIKIGQFLERKGAEQALLESEQQLRQAVKLEAIGRLAGGIAHDFNNVLTVITGYSSMLLSTLERDRIPHSAVLEIMKAANRAASLTSQLLAFSRRQVLQPRLLDLNAVVMAMEHLLRRLIGEDVELLTKPGAAPAVIKADPGQVEQVIMNLAVNARDAMPEGGRLTIATANLELSDLAQSKPHRLSPGAYVVLTVSDTGCGIDAETQAKIFEPFFTTKEKGKGTGLGLSTVYGIVEQSGGHIEVDSASGQGTTFVVYFPGVQGMSQPAELEVPILGPVGGSETILLVEDDPMVRGLLHQVLQRQSYTVLVAANPEAALELSAEYKSLIQLVVTDVVMPMMSGRDLSQRLRGMMPQLRILYMSGYTEDVSDLSEMLDTQSAFIQKPFSPDSLAHKVRELLDRPPELRA